MDFGGLSIKDLWDDATLLAAKPPQSRPFERELAENVIGLIATDVGWRDFRLVGQAKALAVFSPVAPGRDKVSGGVRAEIEKAVDLEKPCFVYQPPAWDLNRHFESFRSADQKSALGNFKVQTYVPPSLPSVEEMLDRVCKAARSQ